MMLWISLLIAVSLSCVASVQWMSLYTDQWWKEFSNQHALQHQKLHFEMQQQRYLLLKRRQAFIEDRNLPASSPSEGLSGMDQDRAPEDESDPNTASKVDFDKNRLQEKGALPLNARLPFFKSLYADPIKGKIYKEAFWKLLDARYGSEKMYRQWRFEVDTEAFLKELFEQIEVIAGKMIAVGSCGLDCIRFTQPADQQIWYEMLKGSDRLAQHYPSITGLIWPVKLAPASCQPRLNLVHTDSLFIEALLGRRFARRWKEMVLEKIDQYSEPGQALMPSLCLPQKEYEQIFSAVAKELGLNAQELMNFVDLTLNVTGSASELLVRTREGLTQVIPLDSLAKKST